MVRINSLFGCTVLALAVSTASLVGADALADESTVDYKKWVIDAEVLREHGDLILAQKKLDLALQDVNKANVDTKDQAAVELATGYNLFLLNKLNAAEQHLKSAYPKTLGYDYLQALADQYLANLYLANGDNKQASFHINNGLSLLSSGKYDDLRLSLELLNLGASQDAAVEKAQKLLLLATRVDKLSDGIVKSKLSLKAIQMALDMEAESLPSQVIADLQRQSYLMLTQLRTWADLNRQIRMKAEATGKLAMLYHWQGRQQEALVLTEQAITQAQDANERELLAQLAAQKGNFLKAMGDNERALAAYEIAIDSLYSVRADMPITLPDGRNLLKMVIDPIYRNYVDLLLLQPASADNAEFANQQLIKAIDSMEAIKEADMQDFFLGRCSMGGLNNQKWQDLSPKNAAVLYPILLKDRIELVVKTEHKLIRRTVNVPLEDVQHQALALVDALQRGKDYRASSKQLYEWLFLPVREELQFAQPDVILYVPDRSLRAVPLSALSDGQSYVIEQYGVVTLPSLDLQNLVAKDKREKQDSKTLLAGLSKPDGASIDQLPSGIAEKLSDNQPLAREHMIDELSLPSVEMEISSVADKGVSTTLLNKQFTAGALKSDIETGDYEKVHIASHGYFGKNAKESFIMAYDRNMTLLDIKDTLEAENLKSKPIELLTLSACKTSVGDDRMLLGFSGLAVKSNVLSAVGSLWSINDDATMEFMRLFYDGMSRALNKAQAMREAQISMIKTKKFKHPFFWSPFILIGNWQ
jgi:CHAT domain-containing protein